MKIAILTQNAPMYLATFLDDLLTQLETSGHEVSFAVLYSPLFGHSALEELRRRHQFYGTRAFVQMAGRIALNKAAASVADIFRLGRAYSPKQVLLQHHVPLHDPISPNTSTFIDSVKAQGIDLIISIACPKILRQPILDAPHFGCINYHTALLPRYRGRQPLFWVLLNNEPETGVSIHEMDTELDNGPILVQKRVPITPNDSLHSLYQKTIAVGPSALVEAIDIIASGDPQRIPNDASQATCFSFPTPEDALRFRQRGKHFF